MIRLMLPALCVCLFATPTWAQSPCCPSPCTETCCETTFRTEVSYVPVTTTRIEKYVDQCGCCRTRCVPCTTMKKVCKRVPVTTCRQVAKPCCPPPVVACCPPPVAPCPPPVVASCPPAPCCPAVAAAPRPRLVTRLRSRRVRY